MIPGSDPGLGSQGLGIVQLRIPATRIKKTIQSKCFSWQALRRNRDGSASGTFCCHPPCFLTQLRHPLGNGLEEVVMKQQSSVPVICLTTTEALNLLLMC